MTANDDLFNSSPASPGASATPEKPAARARPSKREPVARDRSEPSDYTAADIEVLEGLEPVRRRPGMYIGGTDERALHHLFAEVIDNSMDEAVAGHASWIEVTLSADGTLSVADNGRPPNAGTIRHHEFLFVAGLIRVPRLAEHPHVI